MAQPGWWNPLAGTLNELTLYPSHIYMFLIFFIIIFNPVAKHQNQEKGNMTTGSGGGGANTEKLMP